MAPEKSSVNAMQYLKPFLDTGLMGPAKSVCTFSRGFVAQLSGALFLQFANFPSVHVPHSNLDLSTFPIYTTFIPVTTFFGFIISSKLQCPNISCHL